MSPKPFIRSFARFAVIAAALLPVLGAIPAQAIQVGDTLSGVISVGGKDVPLPGGAHSVIEVGFARIIQPPTNLQVTAADYGPISRVVLARIEDGVVAGVVEIVANNPPFPDGWGIASECSRNDIYATLTRHKSGWDVSCLWIQPVFIDTSNIDQTTEKLQALAATSGAVAPTFWIETGFRVANRQDIIEVRYRFAASLDGTPATFNDAARWRPDVIADNPAELEQVQEVAKWASAIYPTVETGLRAPLPADARFAAPFVDAAELPNDRDERLAKIAALRDEGVISEEEFERQEAIIQAESEPVLEDAWTYTNGAKF